MLPGGIFNRNPQEDMAIARTRTQWLLLVATVIFLFTLILWLPNEWQTWLIMVGIYAVAVLGLHITTGLCGQFSMGHAAFMAVGAYTTAVLTGTYDWSPWVTLPLSGLVAGVIGLVFGAPALRIKGIYLVMATIAAQFIILFIIREQSWAGQTFGLHVPQISVGGSNLSNTQFWWMTLALALVSVYFAKNIQRTSPGRKMVAVRDNDLAAEVMGINLFRTKLLAFFLGCFYAGISGWLLAHFVRYVHPDVFSFNLSLTLLGMVIIGGMGSTSGAVLGAIFIRLLDKVVYYLAPQLANLLPGYSASTIAPALQLIMFGVVIASFLLLEPRGIQHRVEKIKLYYRLRPFSYW
jgi:branched-chain amino acid transport system permease protein